MRTSDQVVRKAIGRPAKLRRPSRWRSGGFASCPKCGTSRVEGAHSWRIGRFESNNLRPPHAESARCRKPHSVLFGIRKSRQTALQSGNLYGFPTVARGFSAGHFVIVPTHVMLARFCIAWSLPLAREMIPLSMTLCGNKRLRLARM